MKNGEAAIPSPSKAKRRSLLRIGSWPSPSLLRKQEVTIPNSYEEGESAHPSSLLGKMGWLFPFTPQIRMHDYYYDDSMVCDMML